jgi:isocitrate dehydrogenase kinase/phosphatase
VTTGAEPRQVSRAILDGFDRHYRIFREATLAARGYFEAADWPQLRATQRERIGMYDARVAEAVQTIRDVFPDVEAAEALWPRIKVEFIGLLYDARHKQPECAETFYNSVARRLLRSDYHNNEFIFDRPAVSTEYLDTNEPAYDSYYADTSDLTAAFRSILGRVARRSSFEDLERDLGLVQRAVDERLGAGFTHQYNFQLQVLRSPFFRNRAAYVVGRILNGGDVIPVVVAILQRDDRTLYVDALVFDAVSVSRILSVGRSYFMVDMEVPAVYVDFLASIAPGKPRAELYALVGLQKQGKTLFFRDLVHHLRHSSDTFVLAPGTKGMVMVVFTLPSYPYVFKIIRDWFEAPKDSDRRAVEATYDYVKTHERAGRLADTLEFAHVALPEGRFDPAVLADLERLAPQQIERRDGYIVIRHLYIERRLTPLNLFLAQADDEAARHALAEYGDAVRELASANIFPGDLLLKNFGVTRYGRVIFYDYDEICELTACRFRTIPRARDVDDETAAEPWFMVEKNDVFPEQFPTFLLPDGRQRAIFLEENARLTDASYWRSLQERVALGAMDDEFPYGRALRFSVRFAERDPTPPLAND